MPAGLIFVVSGIVVVLAGAQLARAGETIAERTGLGSAWVGAILVAGATSLPELTTDLFAARQGHAELAVGDLFGSCMFNLVILAVADMLLTRVRVMTRVAINQAVVGMLSIVLMATAAAGMLTDSELSIVGIGWSPLAVGFGYLAGMRLIHANRAGPPFMTPEQARRAALRARDLRTAGLTFAAASTAILVAAWFLASSADDVAGQLGLSTGFMGLALLAATTSLPEVSVTIASIRSGSYDLAVGNLLGSNCFNMVILLPLDIVDGSGPLLGTTAPSIMVGAAFAILLTGHTLLELLNNAEKRVWLLEPDAVFRVAVFAVGMMLMYMVQ